MIWHLIKIPFVSQRQNLIDNYCLWESSQQIKAFIFHSIALWKIYFSLFLELFTDNCNYSIVFLPRRDILTLPLGVWIICKSSYSIPVT